MKKRKIIIPVVVAVIAMLAVIGVIIIKNPYKPSQEAMQIIAGQNSEIEVIQYDEYTTFDSVHIRATRGLVFYPGGLVEPEAYAPLMENLAEAGIFCVVVNMPENLAFFDSDKAELVLQAFPDIKKWYIGGHSLGGAMAANYLKKNIEKFSGLIMLAAYSTSDFSDEEISVLSMYGTQDGVINRDNLRRYNDNLPREARVIPIKGGCHAYFGDYGKQLCDGHPTITREEQITQTTDKIKELILGK